MIQKGDFIELNYTASVKSTGVVFDTTIESEAKKHNIYVKDFNYKPIIICVGEGQLVKELEDFLIGKELGKYTLSIENAFGKKNAKLLRLISIKEFHKHNIQPMPGLEVDLDGHKGIVRTVNGGRVIVDFNHPLASQEITYIVEVKRIVDNEEEKIKGILDYLRFPFTDLKVDGEKAIISYGIDIPKEFTESLANEIKKLTNIKEVEFKQ